MTAALMTLEPNEATAMEAVLIEGDLSKLSAEQRVIYYKKTCESLGLNYLTKPFDYIRLNGKLTFYARKDCTDQLRKRDKVSITDLKTTIADGIIMVTAYAETADGKKDVATGAVNLQGLKGEAYANAVMKAECVPTDYQILTKEGFKHYLDVDICDLVASYNTLSGNIEWVQLENISVFENQSVTKFASNTTEFDFTAAHKWVFLDQSEKNAQLIPFEKAGENDRVLLAAEEHDKFKLDVTPEEAAILGWIITDGTIKKYKGKFYRASICQSKPETIAIIDKLLPNVKRGVTDNRQHGWLNQVWWYLSKGQTQHLFDRFGFTCLSDLPRIAASLDFECRAAMIESMMQADGDKRCNFGKGKLFIFECFQILCTLNGIALSKTRTRIFNNSTQPFYQVRMLSYTSVVKKYLQPIETYKADVWCPTTKHGTWIMRSPEGQISITGNTKAKRRVTLSICGLGFTDESEIDSIPNAQIVNVDDSGYIVPPIKQILPPNPTTVLLDLTVKMKEAKNKDELKNAFLAAYKAFEGQPAIQQEIVELKDSIKQAMDDAIRDFKAELDADKPPYQQEDDGA